MAGVIHTLHDLTERAGRPILNTMIDLKRLNEMPKKKKMVSGEERKSDIWAFILGYWEDRKYTPTLNEIGWYFGKSRQWAQYFVKQLEADGKVKVVPHRIRGIVVLVKK